VQTISDLLEQLVASLLASSTLLQDDNNLFQTCQQLGTSNANTSCWQAVRLYACRRWSTCINNWEMNFNFRSWSFLTNPGIFISSTVNVPPKAVLLARGWKKAATSTDLWRLLVASFLPWQSDPVRKMQLREKYSYHIVTQCWHGCWKTVWVEIQRPLWLQVGQVYCCACFAHVVQMVGKFYHRGYYQMHFTSTCTQYSSLV
jgi:uncharacterized membrane protein YqaE (UPF0057 family)